MKTKLAYMALMPILGSVLAGCMKEDPEYFKKPDWWTPAEEDAGSGEYRLVWSDEFEAESEDGKDWTYPSNDWIFETGGTGWGNGEAQYYVDKVHGDKVVSKVKDGNLVLAAYKLDAPLEGKKYISARMTTKRSWTYGKIEMRAKLCAGRGVWPAFWMLPASMTSDNLLDGEIDIMEYVGYEPGVVWFSLHNKKDRTEEGKNLLTTSYSPSDPENEFHVYGVEWTADYIQAYIDGTPYYTFRNDGSGEPESWPFDKPFKIKLNIAVGGTWGGYMGIDDSIFPAEYVIDYVRVYQR
ncbi:MAG: family 16 glycosylhydrolase [Candidatus Cryptobacteroides sp.]